MFFSYVYYTKIFDCCQELFLGMLRIFLDLWSESCYNISMNEIDIAYIFFLAMCVHLAYTLGKQLGIRTTIDYLEHKGLIEFDDSEK